MTTPLEPRHKAMLAEMGVRVWAPPDRSGGQHAPAIAAAPDTPKNIAETQGSVPAQAPKTLGAQGPARSAAAVPPAPALVTPSPSTTPSAARPAGIERMDWAALEQAVAGCQACGLCRGRTRTVFGVGATQARWMVVGEAPGEHEDRQGEPFVGQAGKLLDQMLAAIGLSRHADRPAAAEGSTTPAAQSQTLQGVYIANVLKCRPPGNRNPLPDEIAQCEPYLRRQVELVRPRIILAMGRFAVQSLLGSSEPIGRLRGRVHQYQGVPVIVTYHPAYLLRALPEKAKAWADLCLALEVTQRHAG